MRPTACAECPFRTMSARGLTGGWSPDLLINQVKYGDLSCPSEPGHGCVGAAIFARNVGRVTRGRLINEMEHLVSRNTQDIFPTEQALKDHHSIVQFGRRLDDSKPGLAERSSPG